MGWVLAFLSLACFGDRLTPYRDGLARQGYLKEVKIDGARIVYADMGQGKPVVLLHGLGGSLFDWRHITPDLAQRGCRVLVPDMLGSGESDAPEDADYSVREHARRMVALLDHLGIKRASFVGNSYGGGVSLMVATEWPDRVEKLALLDAACYPDGMPLDYYLLYAACQVPEVPEKVIEMLPPEPVACLLLRRLYYDTSLLTRDVVRSYAVEAAPSSHRRALVKMVRAIKPSKLGSHLAKVKKIDRPAMVIWGEHDEIFPVALGRRLAKHLGTRCEVIANAGHLPHMEQPEKVVPLLAEFLK